MCAARGWATDPTDRRSPSWLSRLARRVGSEGRTVRFVVRAAVPVVGWVVLWAVVWSGRLMAGCRRGCLVSHGGSVPRGGPSGSLCVLRFRWWGGLFGGGGVVGPSDGRSSAWLFRPRGAVHREGGTARLLRAPRPVSRPPSGGEGAVLARHAAVAAQAARRPGLRGPARSSGPEGSCGGHGSAPRPRDPSWVTVAGRVPVAPRLLSPRTSSPGRSATPRRRSCPARAACGGGVRRRRPGSGTGCRGG